MNQSEPLDTRSAPSGATNALDVATKLQATLHTFFAVENRLQTFEQWTRLVISLSDWQGMLPQQEIATGPQGEEVPDKGARSDEQVQPQ
ncbi:hypothetical protein FRC03_005378 [Tulasnella sp. 419]|nr:hypothetical protein FRC03_005378 [Tulasnella sp. 419]